MPSASSTSALWFYENYFATSRVRIPWWQWYDRWRRKVAHEMDSGEHLYYLGPNASSDEWEDGHADAADADAAPQPT